jgi:zinc protease
VRPPARLRAPIVFLIAALTGSGLACVRGPAAPGGARATLAGAPGIAPAAPEGVQEEAAATLGSLTIRKWRLGNGLSIITAPDPGARAVSYVTAYNVGSRDEDASRGETGLAHLCEHLMFTQTRGGRGPGDFDRRLEEMGGNSNAGTDHDFTFYVDDVPPEALERTIALEADRMVNLELADAAVAAEREIVVEERLMAAEDDIDGQLDELVYAQAFRAHPYRFPVVGRMVDIKAVTKERVSAFYRKHYGPDRALVIVAGRFDEASVLTVLASDYAALPASGTVATVVAPERAPTGEVRSSIERPVPADRFMVGYPAPALGESDRAAYDVLDELLTGGPSSRLYRTLVVEKEVASSLESEVPATRDPALWTVLVQMLKGHASAEAEAMIRRELDRVIAEPPTPAELDAARNRLETGFWTELGSSQGRAEALAQFALTTDDFRTLLNRGAAYARVAPTDVSRVARAYLGTGARSLVVAHPKGAHTP